MAGKFYGGIVVNNTAETNELFTMQDGTGFSEPEKDDAAAAPEVADPPSHPTLRQPVLDAPPDPAYDPSTPWAV